MGNMMMMMLHDMLCVRVGDVPTPVRCLLCGVMVAAGWPGSLSHMLMYVLAAGEAVAKRQRTLHADHQQQRHALPSAFDRWRFRTSWCQVVFQQQMQQHTLFDTTSQPDSKGAVCPAAAAACQYVGLACCMLAGLVHAWVPSGLHIWSKT
jgi:hypothetical protein